MNDLIIDNVKIKKVLVVGLGFRTGLAVSNFLAKRNIEVLVSDKKKEAELEDILGKLDSRVKVKAGDQSTDLLTSDLDFIILSPGVPASIPLITEALQRKIPVLSEIELASYFLKGTVIAVTGTDGKSTTTALIKHILKELGYDAFMGGNIGIPLISLVDKTDQDSVLVVELSSFQLEHIIKFRPRIALFLNFSPDHLDRYQSLDDYFQAKQRITLNQTRNDLYIYNLDDSYLVKNLPRVVSKKLSFSLDPSQKSEAALYADQTCIYNSKGDEVLDGGDLNILGRHNLQNVMAAWLAVASFLNKAVDDSKIRAACISFQPLSHRLERVRSYRERIFINDSKATTINATLAALRSFSSPVVLFLGGRSKGDDFQKLAPEVFKRVKHLILFGEAQQELGKVFANNPKSFVSSLEEGIQEAISRSEAKEVILFSPACASFDMFRDYEERGDQFKKIVKNLGK